MSVLHRCLRNTAIGVAVLFSAQFLPAQLNYKIGGASERAGETAGAAVGARINMLQSSSISPSTSAASGLALCHDCVASETEYKDRGRFSQSTRQDVGTLVHGAVPMKPGRGMIQGEYQGVRESASFPRGATSLFSRATGSVDRWTTSGTAITAPYRVRSQFDAFGVGNESVSGTGYQGGSVSSIVAAPVSEREEGTFPDSTKGTAEISPPDSGTHSPLEWDPSIDFAFKDFEKRNFLNPQFRVGMRSRKHHRMQKKKQTTSDELRSPLSSGLPEAGSLIESQKDFNQSLDPVIK